MEQIVTSAAAKFGLEARLVLALVRVESSGNPWAWNPEPVYRYFWNVRTNAPFRQVLPHELHDERPPKDFARLGGDPDQEWWGQQASWGLMQVMGALARELGFRGTYLTQLCDPEINVGLGCLHLSRLMKWADGDVDRTLAAYNGGKGGNMTRPFRSQLYADKVLAIRNTL